MVGITDCNICLTQPCRNDGLCLASATRLGFTCECQPGFTGHDCSDRIARCFPGACGEDGHCINTGNQNFKCKCPIGRYGSRCEIGMFESFMNMIHSSDLKWFVHWLVWLSLICVWLIWFCDCQWYWLEWLPVIALWLIDYCDCGWFATRWSLWLSEIRVWLTDWLND